MIGNSFVKSSPSDHLNKRRDSCQVIRPGVWWTRNYYFFFFDVKKVLFDSLMTIKLLDHKTIEIPGILTTKDYWFTKFPTVISFTLFNNTLPPSKPVTRKLLLIQRFNWKKRIQEFFYFLNSNLSPYLMWGGQDTFSFLGSSECEHNNENLIKMNWFWEKGV